MIFGKGNYYQLLYSTLVQGPQASSGFNIGSSSSMFLTFREFPSIFGYFLTGLFYFTLLFWILFLLSKIKDKKIKNYKTQTFIFITSILFLLSTISFSVDGGGNRALVLLPFMILTSTLLINELFNFVLFKKYKNIVLTIIFLGLCLQIVQSVSWISVKFYRDPREVSSNWIVKNIPEGSGIGIENIPIYQMLPDFVLKEFYSKQHDNNLKTRYKYTVVSSKNINFPNYVIVTNDFNNLSYIKNSPKKDLINKLKDEKYKKIKEFMPNLNYYNLFADKLYFVLANIMPIPVNISIYEK